jgi:hypothetical protein
MPSLPGSDSTGCRMLDADVPESSIQYPASSTIDLPIAIGTPFTSWGELSILSRRALVRLQVECDMEHGGQILVFLFAVSSLPAVDADWLTGLIRTVA